MKWMRRGRRARLELRGWVIGAAMLAAGLPTAASGQVALVEQGEPRATIVLAEDADEPVQRAAEELVTHLREMSGAELPVAHAIPDDGKAIILGAKAPEGFLSPLERETDKHGSFRLVVDDERPRRIIIAGLDDDGTLYGAYAMLEQLGVRWFMPDDIGRIIPERDDVAVEVDDRLEIPSFAGRQLQQIASLGHTGGRVWADRMRLGGFNAGRHGLRMTEMPDPDEEPELFMTEDGRQTSKVRINHPETIRRTIEETRRRLDEGREDAVHEGVRYVSMGPRDGLGFGEDEWDAGDIDPLHGRVSVSDRYVRFFNKIIEAVEDEHEDVGIAFYCYSQHMRAPVREQPHPNILPVLAPIDVCRFHSIDDEHCWERQYVRDVIEDWRALGTRMMYRGYLFNLADPSLPFSMIRQVSTELPYFHEAGMFASRIETQPAWGYQAPTFYLAARLMWDIDADVDALLEEYFDGLYGPASGPMREHFEILEDAFQHADYHTGNIFDFPHILTPEVLDEMEATLAEAESAAADDETISARIAMVRLAFDYGVTLLEMIEATHRFDFVEAKARLDRLYDELIPLAVEHDPPILSRRYVPAFVDRFWRDGVEEGYARVTDGNTMLVELPDTWQVKLDPHDGGESLGLWKPGLGEHGWKPLETYSTAWANQGLRYYKGPQAHIWYRTRFDVPADLEADAPVYLWLSGVDNRAEAWINGHQLDRLRSGAAPIGRPWEFDAVGVLEPGEENVIVVKVSNDVHRELGTGGLTGPAMLWQAREHMDEDLAEDEQIDPLDFLPGQ